MFYKLSSFYSFDNISKEQNMRFGDTPKRFDEQTKSIPFSEAKRRLTNYSLKSLYNRLIIAHEETTLNIDI